MGPSKTFPKPAILGCALLLAMAVKPGAPRAGAGPLEPERPPPTFIAHRGYSRRFPENTVGSIREAADRGARWVEVDVRWTHGGEPVLSHDAFDGDGEGLATLRQAVESMAGRRASLYLHLKGGELGDEEARKLVALCRSYEFLGKVRFNSGSFETLRRLRREDAAVWLEYDLYDAKGLLRSNRPTEADLDALRELAVRSVGTYSFKIDAGLVDEAHRHGLLIDALVSAPRMPFHAESAAYRDMRRLNVDEIMTDEIARYLPEPPKEIISPH